MKACAVKKIHLGQAQTERPDVDREDIASIVRGGITGIKVQGVMDNEREHLLNLDRKLPRQRIVEQDQAVQRFRRRLRSSKNSNQRSVPIGSFSLGPTGVRRRLLWQKSLLSGCLVMSWNGPKLDMSGMEKHAWLVWWSTRLRRIWREDSWQKLHSVGGYSIVLLDEVKAHRM